LVFSLDVAHSKFDLQITVPVEYGLEDFDFAKFERLDTPEVRHLIIFVIGDGAPNFIFHNNHLRTILTRRNFFEKDD